MQQPWEITTSECTGDKDSLMRRGNVYQIANGYMGCRGTLDEFGPGECVAITLAGIFDQVGGAWREPVNAPNGAFTTVEVDGVELSAVSGKVVRHSQTLRLRTAEFTRETEFDVDGKRVTLRSTRFLSIDRPNLGAVRFEVECDKAAEITLRTGIDFNIWDLNGPHLRDFKASERDGVLSVEARTHEVGKCVTVAETIDAEFGTGSRLVSDNRNLHVITVRVEPGKPVAFGKYFALFTDNDPVDGSVAEAAIMAVTAARRDGFESLREEHRAGWESRWRLCDVAVEGDPAAQLALRYSILQLLMVAPVAGSANSIPARALSGQAYKGAVFWDTEMFMFPFFLHTHPEKAVELLRYRIRTLDGARRKAATEGPGYRGAFYAWESQDTGDDACTYFNIGDPITGRELRTHFRDKQVHISGDVAIAMWRYFEVTGDDSLLLEGGAEVILECARFYYSYIHFKKDRGRYEVLDVIGPDEYHERVNNNAFTNRVVHETFAIAGATVDHLARNHPEALQALIGKIGIEDELACFADAAVRLYLPQADKETGVIEQFEGYFKLRDATVDELRAKMVHPNEYLGASQGLAVPTKLIKQADVVMMLSLFKSRFPTELKRANWCYYEPRTEHGSSLSACAYALVAAEFGDLDSAYRYFLKTAEIDLKAKYKTYTGTIFMGGTHPAANGGAWMTAVFGFGGVHADASRVVIEPRLPSKWRALEFSLVYKGDRFRIRMERGTVTISPDSANRAAHVFSVAGSEFTVSAGATVTVPLGDGAAIAAGNEASEAASSKPQ